MLLAGPTAGGKSALALALAERDHGLIINADALQVYSFWRVLTARPGPADVARAPHALYGHVDPSGRYSVGHWLRDLAPQLERAAAEGRRAIVVGGTGLYFTSLTSGLSAIPEVPDDIRDASAALIAGDRIDVLLEDLARRDPETLQRLDPHNPQRVQRAWEVLTATGRGLAAWHRDPPAPPLVPPAQAVRMVVSPEPSVLNRNIEARFLAMLAGGALDECRAALSAGWDPARPSAHALGARELIGFLHGETPLDVATAAAIVATRRLAKRQRTWFRSRMADWTWLDPSKLTAADILVAIPTD